MSEYCKGQSNIEAARDAAQQKRDNMPGQQMTEAEAAVEAIRASRWDELTERCGPSPEAKQAAMEAGLGKTGDRARVCERIEFCKGYDTATAKLREELVKTQELVLQRDSEIAQLKWKMQEVDKALWDEAKPKGYEPDRAEAIRAVRKLAQPSAITTNEQAYRDGTLSQPSDNSPIRDALEEAAKAALFEYRHGTNGLGIAAAIRHLATHPKWRDQQPSGPTAEPIAIRDNSPGAWHEVTGYTAPTGEKKECPNCGRDLDECHGNCIF